MRTHRLLALAGVAITAMSLAGCILPPPRGQGPDRDSPSARDRDGDGRYDNRGDGDRAGRWDRGERPPGPSPVGGYGPRY